MSDQPITGVPPAGPAATQKVPGRGGIWLGILLIVLGLAGALALFLVQQASYSGTVDNLVRALPGYRTELIFEKTGTFTFYYEYAGTFTTTLDGVEQTVTLDAPPTPPELDPRLFDQNGDEVRLRDGADGVTYDVSGHKGVAIGQVDIETAGPYTLEVVSDSEGFALAAGKGTVSKPSAVLPAIIALIGVILGLVVIIVSSSRRAKARREADQLAIVPAAVGPVGAYPAPGAVMTPGGGPPLWPPAEPDASPPGAADLPPASWAPQPPPQRAGEPVTVASRPAPAPSSWSAPAAPDAPRPDAPPADAPRPDAPTVPTPVTTPLPVQPAPGPTTAPPAFPPPGAAAPEATPKDEDPPAPTSPWGAPSPPS